MATGHSRDNAYNPLLKRYPESEKVNAVSEGAECLYTRLIAQSDDAGRYYADPVLVLAKLFTLRMANGLTVAEVSRRIDELQKIGLIKTYAVDGRRYLQIVDVFKTFRKDVKRKVFFPEPLTESVTDSSRVRCEHGPLEPEPEPEQTKPEKKARLRSPFSLDAVTFPESLDTPKARTAAAAWLEHRKRINKPYKSPDSFAKQLEEFARAGPDAFADAVNHSIAREYQGIFPRKDAGNGNRLQQRSFGYTPNPGLEFVPSQDAE